MVGLQLSAPPPASPTSLRGGLPTRPPPRSEPPLEFATKLDGSGSSRSNSSCGSAGSLRGGVADAQGAEGINLNPTSVLSPPFALAAALVQRPEWQRRQTQLAGLIAALSPVRAKPAAPPTPSPPGPQLQLQSTQAAPDPSARPAVGSARPSPLTAIAIAARAVAGGVRCAGAGLGSPHRPPAVAVGSPDLARAMLGNGLGNGAGDGDGYEKGSRGLCVGELI
ncbi:hypothetical protein T492DRAFT_133663, partial [Pavlovales sp. CCMP2436]